MDKLDEIFAKYADSHAREVPARKVSENASEGKKETSAKILALKKHLVRKDKADKRALRAVESMLEPGMKPEDLLFEAQFICQYHFDDVTEERAYVEKICGYPTCSQVLDKIRPQDYYISVKVNAIFDVKERKKFCSLACFRAAEFLKNQLATEPVWLREHDEVDGEGSRRVVTAAFKLYDPVKHAKRSPRRRSTLSSSSSEEAADDEKEEDERRRVPDNKIGGAVSRKKREIGSVVFDALRKQQRQRNVETVDSDDDDVDGDDNVRVGYSRRAVPEPTEDGTKWISEVWSCVEEWLTPECGLYLFDQNVDRFVSELRTWRESASHDAAEVLPSLESALDGIRRRLTRDARRCEDRSASKEETLGTKKQGIDEVMAAKIRAFYSGQFVFETPVPAEKSESDAEGDGPEKADAPLHPDEIPILCPVLPEKKPAALRRQIFVEKIAKNGMQDLCHLMQISWLGEVGDRLSGLSKTLNLTSANICLPSRGWKLAAVIILRLLKHGSTEVAEAFDRVDGAIFVDDGLTVGPEEFAVMDDRLFHLFFRSSENESDANVVEGDVLD